MSTKTFAQDQDTQNKLVLVSTEKLGEEREHKK